MTDYIRWFKDLSKSDIALAGGKGANLGEMTAAGLPVPPGFVVTAAAYREFIAAAGLGEAIANRIAALDVDDTQQLEEASDDVRELISQAAIPPDIALAVRTAYDELCGDGSGAGPLVAVRSSATIEDTEAASFAGMNRSFMNVGSEAAVVEALKNVWASLYSPRAIFYRGRMRLEAAPEIAVIVQKMVNSTAAGVAFSLNPATGDTSRIVIEAALGLGEVVVDAEVEPDHYEVDKTSLQILMAHPGHQSFMLTRNERGENIRVELPSDEAGGRALSDEQVLAVAELARRDEEHYGTPQDAEWAIEDGHVHLVQSRPVTVRGGAPTVANGNGDGHNGGGRTLVHGLSAGPGVAAGRVRIVRTVAEGKQLQSGEVLVAPATSPDWLPFMRRAAAVVTEAGGMTSHAAIVSREMGLPCVVGARDATSLLQEGMEVTVDAGAGNVLEGHVESVPAQAGPATTVTAAGPGRIVTATKLLVNLAEPEIAERVAAQPVDGVGLLRAEFMLLSALQGVHPRRLLEQGRGAEFVARMTEQLSIFARSFYPRPVVYRSTDFRTNEFRGLDGGDAYEPHEENPMIGVRGAFRYVLNPDLFEQELQVLGRVREDYPNIYLMIPFVRTGSEMRTCAELVRRSGLFDSPGFELWVMAEVPSVVYWLDEYARLGVSGVSIGSNDLTQLVLGIDRDSAPLAPLFDERDRAVTETIRAIIGGCRRLGLKVSICGQAPSTYPEYAELLVRMGIDSISVNPDAIERTRYNIAAAEQRLLLELARRA